MESAVKKNKQAFKVKITAVPEEVIKADKVILPGVGDFFYCKNELLKINGLIDAINYFIKDKGKPFLGICIGMQLMANTLEENTLFQAAYALETKSKLPEVDICQKLV